MKITCESCATTFNLDERLLKPEGSKVRCSQCRQVFVAYPAVDAGPAPVAPDPSGAGAEREGMPVEREPELTELEKLLDTFPEEGLDPEEAVEPLFEDVETEIKITRLETEEAESSLGSTLDDSFALDIDELNRTDAPIEEKHPQEGHGEEEAGEPDEDFDLAFDNRAPAETDPAFEMADEFNVKSSGMPIEESTRKVHPALILSLLLVLIVGGVYWGAYWAHRTGTEIPLLSQLAPMLFDQGNSVQVDAKGSRKITTFDINSRIIENRTGGKIFVISGEVRNDYDHPRGLIHIKGDLYATGQKHVKTETAYCGNVLSDLDLEIMDVPAIHEKLGDRFGGDGKANLKLMPKQTLPFMIVFDNLPEGLEEFTLEVAGSMPM